MKIRWIPLQFLCLSAVVFTASGATASAQVVVSQVYGGGGNSGATYRKDFIEVFNLSSQPVDLTNWSVQYASSTGSTWQTTNLAGELQPGQYYLVHESQGAGGTADLPAADASGSIAMSATAGKIALVNTTIALSGACPQGSTVIDFVGYGTGTNCSLGAVAPTLSNTTAALRAKGGCADARNNAADFTSGTPTPRNTSSPVQVCSAGGGITLSPTSLPTATVNVPYLTTITASGGVGPYTFQYSGTLPPGITLTTDGTLSGSPNTTVGSPFTFTITVTDALGATASASYSLTVNGQATCNPTATIAQIQGSGITSTLFGRTVTVSGVVTGSDRNGFFVQMPATGDGDPATSDGLYVFTSGGIPSVARPGNLVCVVGPVGEFAPSSDPGSPTNTEINGATSVTLISSGNPLPPPVVLTASDTDPSGSLYQLEKYEGMRVQIPQLLAVAPTGGTVNETTATAVSDGVFYGVLPGIARPFREPGVQLPDALPAGSPPNVPRWDANPEVVSVDTSRLAAPLDVATGAVVNDLTGPLIYTNRAYTVVIEPTSGANATASLKAVPVPLANPEELTISSFNLERFYDTGGADSGTSHPVPTATAFNNRLNKASLAIRNVLNTPDILAVEEVQNLRTLQSLANKVNSDAAAAGQVSPAYVPYLSLGNDISGINSGFLVKTPKVSVVSVTQYGKDTTFTNASGSQATLNDRPPLVLVANVQRPGSDTTFPVTVVVNHLRSLLDLNDPASGATVRAKREAQAEYLAKLIQGFQASDPNANIVSVGDYNAYQFSDGFVDSIGVIKGVPAPPDQVVLPGPSLVYPVLTDLIDTDLLPQKERYSYSFTGSAQALDHIIVNQNMLSRVTGFAYARNDADFPEIYRNDPNRPERVSDHDIPEARFSMPAVVSSKLAVTDTGFLFSRVSRLYTGVVTVTNTGGTAIAGPVYLALNNLPNGISLSGPSRLMLSNTGLQPGESATVAVNFSNPGNLPITYVPVTYSGTL